METITVSQYISRGSPRIWRNVHTRYSCMYEMTYWIVQVVAVKQIPVDASAPKVASFKSELGVAMSLRHPCLVQVHGVCSNSTVQPHEHALVMQYLPFNLSRLINGDMLDGTGHDVPTADLVLILMDIANGLAYLHNSANHTNALNTSITHSDLKPANILLTQQRPYRAEIADFGLSHLEQKIGISYSQTLKTSAAGVMGTPHYMAYELFEDEPLRGTYNDIYALGCVMIELFSKQRPWPGLRPQQILGRLVCDGTCVS